MTTKQSPLKRWSISSDDLRSRQQQNCLYQSLPEELGMGRSAEFQLDHDMSFIETRYTPSKNLAVLNKIEFQEPRLIVTLGLKGQSRFAEKGGDELVFNEGYTSITTLQSSIGERQYEAHKPTLQLRFALNKSWLDRYFGNTKTSQIFNHKSPKLLTNQRTSPQAICIAKQLLISNTSNETNRLFIHGQAMSLLSFELNQLCGDTRQNSAEFTQRDEAIAKLARDILFREFKNPPSVEELSRRVGINQCKLKKLFHYCFKNTPYGLVLDFRMTNAYQLLESTRCQVAVAAEMSGYSHASNFSAAFIKHFGIAPKEITKKH
jgi:AraC-like DNA-binding protein